MADPRRPGAAAPRQLVPVALLPHPEEGALRPGRVVLALGAAAGLALALALVLGGGAPEPALPGLPDPGVLTGWGLPAATLLLHVTAVVAVGSLLTGAVLVPAAGGVLQEPGTRAVRSAARPAALWAALGAVTALLTASSVVALPVGDVLSGRAGTWADVLALPGVRAPLVSACGAFAVAAYASAVRTAAGAGGLLLAALLALGPLLVTGHASAAEGHVLATTALVVHVVGATLWVGGLLGLVLHLRRDPAVLAAAAPVFSTLAAACLVLVAASGAASALGRLGTDGAAWASGYGALVLVKLAALAALAGLGLRHRRATLPRLAAGQPRALLRLAAGELVVMGAALGLGVALSRTPGPLLDTTVTPSHGAGHDTLGATLEPFGLQPLLTAWQPDAVALALVGLALVAYAQGLRAVHRAGGRWPAARTASFAAGLGLAVLATCGGLAVYAPALLSVHVTRSIVLVLLVPLLLLVGRPGALLHAARPGAAAALGVALRGTLPARARSRPVLVALGVVAAVAALHSSAALETALRSVPVHLLAGLTQVGLGLLLLGALLPSASTAPRRARVAGTAALVAGLAVLGVALLLREPLLAEGWFGTLEGAWLDARADQRRAGALLLLSLQVLAPLLLLAVWSPAAPAPARLHGLPRRSGTGARH